MQRKFPENEKNKNAESKQNPSKDKSVRVISEKFIWPDPPRLTDDKLKKVRCLIRPVFLKYFLVNDDLLSKVREAFPHAADAITLLSRSDSDVLDWGEITPIRPVILVGPPGCGKSSLARFYCEKAGIPSKIVNATGISESMTLSGSHRSWGSSAPSIVTEWIAETKSANPCIIVDEIDKAPIGVQYGNILDTLLQLLEPEDAKLFYDLSLNTSVDASYVRWIFTANNISKLPPALKSRCSVVHMKAPGKEHVAKIAKNIVKKIADERKISSDWFELTPMDVSALENIFSGDIRSLKPMITAILKDRVQTWAKA
ncbi:hypothetical protein A0U91_16625 (plasmid) [Acetobacter persici]|uniref:AAA+ ATPase domain-containing protein n=1 Tax=Acetobacter persici TaxID=1076596 RepID=A0A1U9LJN1_9PROT|nr:hypothetical protein A0U91_16625 [Acetobacter persici]